VLVPVLCGLTGKLSTRSAYVHMDRALAPT
jgi:hypothetical protein